MLYLVCRKCGDEFTDLTLRAWCPQCRDEAGNTLALIQEQQRETEGEGEA